MMAIALNGCGRIGKNFVRALYRDRKARAAVRIAVINVGPTDPASLAYSLKFDSVDRAFELPIEYRDGKLHIDGDVIPVIAKRDPAECAWKQYGVDWVVDVTGKYTERAKAEEHLRAGARRVLISAPAHGDDCTIIMGVNTEAFVSAKHTIVSLGSCTTNAVVPILAVLEDVGTITFSSLSTTHAYTNSQVLLDGMGSSKDMRRLRSAAINIVPSSTGAIETVQRVMPHLAGKIAGGSLRVPVANVSIVDIVAMMDRDVTVAQLHAACHRAATGKLAGVLATTCDPLVSSDFQGNPHSAIIDEGLTGAVGPHVKIMGWYDNEVGYSERMKDFLCHAAAQ